MKAAHPELPIDQPGQHCEAESRLVSDIQPSFASSCSVPYKSPQRLNRHRRGAFRLPVSGTSMSRSDEEASALRRARTVVPAAAVDCRRRGRLRRDDEQCRQEHMPTTTMPVAGRSCQPK